MNIKELIVPLLLAFIGTFAINYFFFTGKDGNVPATDRRFIAPTSVQVAEPLDLDIDFFDAKPTRKTETTALQLPYGMMQFSNDGAVIDYIGYDLQRDGKPSLIETVTPSKSKIQGAFLVALDGLGKTPYYYNLVDKKDADKSTILTYKGTSDAATITKQFTVHHDTYVVDLVVTIDPKKPVRPRIFFPAPYLAADEDDVTNAVLMSGNDLEKKPVKDLLQVGVEQPSIFGLEDKYFTLVLYKDPEQFAQRAYFKIDGERALGVIQSNEIKDKKTWNLSFYVGPKELAALSKVDVRLEGLLSYGWLAPLSKLLLSILIFLYGIFKNYGIAIIMLTALMQIALLPFTMHAEKVRKKTEESRKKLEYIERRYKDKSVALRVV